MEQGRTEERGGNVIDVNYDAKSIKDAIERQIKVKRFKPNHLYGNGFSSKKILEVIKNLNISIQKKNAY